METTFTLEFRADADTEKHLKALEQQLKHIHDVQVGLIEPKDHTAPAIFAIGIKKAGERGEKAVQSVAQLLYNFLHEDPSVQDQKQIFLVTIEGERIDIEPLAEKEVEGIILAALEHKPV